MEEDTIDVVPSEDNGNVPAETPSEPTETPVAPADDQTPVEPTEPEVELYELPDGRKVDADTLQKEWKENFYPEFTRRSQELAELKKGTLPKDNEPTDPYSDPEWQPKTYAELLEIAKQEAVKAIENKEIAERETIKAIENEVISQIESIKKIDPSVNENALFQHANKYGFKDLTVAYQNMKDMNNLVKTVQQTTVANIAKRSDPVSVSPGATGTKPDPSQFSTAVEYLRALKGSS